MSKWQNSSRTTEEWTLATWNIRTLRGDGKKEVLASALHKVGVDICAVSETRWFEDSESDVVTPDIERYHFWIGKDKRVEVELK